MQISKRLRTVASLVTAGSRVADVGTDHAYVPITLVMEGRVPEALAMDIGEGPLQRALEHIREQGLEGRIQVRQSDGLAAYRQGEADSLVIAGMGGSLMEQILSQGEEKCRGMKEMILSPQSELYLVRQWLGGHGWSIDREIMLIEEGKYYTVMRAVPGNAGKTGEAEDCYGGYLLRQRDPVLREFLEKEWDTIHRIITALEAEKGEHIENRREELGKKLLLTEEALAYYEVQ